MIILVTTVACFVCGLIGYFVGWVTTVDRQERRAEPVHDGPGSIVTARESDEFWEGVYAGGHARTSPRVTAAGGFPALAAQAPLRELVSVPGPGDPPRDGAVPGRATDFIEEMKANTDTWLAARGLEAL